MEVTGMNLKSMSIDRLADLRNRVDAALSAKVIDQRRALASELSKLTRFEGGRGKSALGRGGARGPVAAKYRNPENASETWAGRGLKPRWLTAAIKSGKKLESFLIAGASTSAKANGRKKARKVRK
jgi:DNA-binding protein H-NS